MKTMTTMTKNMNTAINAVGGNIRVRELCII